MIVKYLDFNLSFYENVISKVFIDLGEYLVKFRIIIFYMSAIPWLVDRFNNSGLSLMLIFLYFCLSEDCLF